MQVIKQACSSRVVTGLHRKKDPLKSEYYSFLSFLLSVLLYHMMPSSLTGVVYEIQLHETSENYSAYCHMLGQCGGGGWSLVMKIDGNKV